MRKLIISTTMLLLAGFLFFQLRGYADLGVIKQQQQLIQTYIAHQFWFATMLFLLLYIIVCACALPFGGILTFSGGYFFGLLYTASIVCIGATIGAVIAFLLARYVLQDVIEQRYPKQVQWLNNEIDNHGAHYMLFIRLLPFMPYFIINPVAGLTRISLFTFTWTMALGVIPSTIALAFAGREFAQVSSLRGVLSWHMVAVMSMFALLALLPLVVKKVRGWKKTDVTDQLEPSAL